MGSIGWTLEEDGLFSFSIQYGIQTYQVVRCSDSSHSQLREKFRPRRP